MKKRVVGYIQKRRRINAAVMVFFCLASAIVLLPMVYMIASSFMSPSEVSFYYGSIYNGEGSTYIHLIPRLFSLNSYYQVLLRRPEYLQKFWNSIFLCGSIVFGQVIVSCMGGYAFAKHRFRGKNVLFYLIIILMMMPVQVTLVPNYIMLNNLRLLNTYWALILPAVFLPFGTFLMTQIFKSIPDEIIDAARLDGATTYRVLTRILVPAGKGGLISLIILSFIDAWNMVEQPMIYLSDSLKYPLSVFLAGVNSANFPLSFACGVLAMLPGLLLFLFFNNELVEGIEFSGIK